MLRRAGLLALTALLLPAAAGTATADAAKRKKPHSPVVKKVAPKHVFVGETLTIYGRYFRRGVNKNTVAFKRKGAKVVFVKAEKGTTKLLKVKLPKRLESALPVLNGARVPARLAVRVLAARFGKRFTKRSLSPIVGPEKPPTPPTPPEADPNADCDGDGQINRVDADDDNDLLSDDLEKSLKLDGCKVDSDGDGVEDGYEYQSARDLNDDRYQGDPNDIVPYPVKRPYPNPLFKDANLDYDGDSLTLAEEQALWRFTYGVNHTATRTLALSYSDGTQHSVQQPVAGYAMREQFLAWAAATRYGTVLIPPTRYFDASYTGWHDIRDVNLQGGVEPTDLADADYDADGLLSDDERDEDADGLSNYVESHGQLTPEYWSGCYTMENAWPSNFAGTRIDDADTDGDGIRDGADDQDHDDLPNLMELSRILASGGLDDSETDQPCKVKEGLELGVDRDGDGEIDIKNANHPDAYGRVNPFNPCLPFKDSRTCPVHPPIDGGAAPFDGSPNWLALD